MNTATRATASTASPDVYHRHPDEDADGIDQDACSVFSTPPPTPVETSSASTPRAQSPTRYIFIDDQDDNQVPIVEVCSGGDMVLNVRRLGYDETEEGLTIGSGALNTSQIWAGGKPLGRFRVSSAVLQTASHHVKNCLDATLQMSTTVSGRTKRVAPVVEGLPLLLWLYMDGSQSLSVLTQTKVRTAWHDYSNSVPEGAPDMNNGGVKALAILLRILHFKLNAKDSIKTKMFDVAVMATLVAEVAYALDCVGPVVPWISFWLTRDLPGMDTLNWYRSAEAHYVGIVLGYVMCDETAFERWSISCIRYGCDSDNFVGLGYVWSIINRKLFYYHVLHYLLSPDLGSLDDLQTRRRNYIGKLLAVLGQIWNQYQTDQPTAIQALAYSVALGAFARAVNHMFGHHPPFVNISWEGSFDDLMVVFKDIKRRIDTVWRLFITQNRSSQTITSFRNPADAFWERAETVWEGMEGLVLQNYNSEAEELLDVNKLLEHSFLGS